MAAAEHGPQDLEDAPGSPADLSGPRGWLRALIALGLGLLAGALIALLLPRDDGPRRSPRALPEPVLAPGATPERGRDPAMEEQRGDGTSRP